MALLAPPPLIPQPGGLCEDVAGQQPHYSPSHPSRASLLSAPEVLPLETQLTEKQFTRVIVIIIIIIFKQSAVIFFFLEI